MKPRGVAHDLVRLLDSVAGGSVEALIDGEPLARLDGNQRTVTVQIRSIPRKGDRSTSLLHESRIHFWEIRGIPSALARSGWQVSFRDGPQELLRLGRTASALTGHIHVNPAALWKLRRVL